jgi:polar amino acid transport system substrate-binding protein
MVQGNCVGWVYDDTAFPGLLEDKAKWGDYEAVLPPIMPDPWGLAVPLPEREKAYGRFMAGMIYEWHRAGRIAELEKKWQLPASPFIAAMHQKFAAVPTN